MRATRKSDGLMRRHRVVLRKALIVCASIGLASTTPGLFPSPAFAAAPTPPFNQCPAVGYNTRCTLLIDVTGTGLLILQDPGATLGNDPVPGTYDGVEDTLIGVVNNSSVPVSQLTLSSNSEPLFVFDGDGICQDPNQTSGKFGLHCNGTIHNGNNYFNPHDTTGYGGYNAFFTNISTDFKTGIVHFFNPIPPAAPTSSHSRRSSTSPTSARTRSRSRRPARRRSWVEHRRSSRPRFSTWARRPWASP